MTSGAHDDGHPVEVRLLVLAARLSPPPDAQFAATEILTNSQASMNWPYLQDQAMRHRITALLGHKTTKTEVGR